MNDTFARSRTLAHGYHTDQVDAFFARARVVFDHAGSSSAVTSWHVRTVGFDLVRGGYDIEAVDSAMDRLEDAFAERERRRGVTRAGEQGWLEDVRERAQMLIPRLRRADGQRFLRANGWEVSYDPSDVDRLCRQLSGYFSDGGPPLSVDEVRRAVFRPRRGSRGYREAPVDAFLDRVVEVMVAVD